MQLHSTQFQVLTRQMKSLSFNNLRVGLDRDHSNLFVNIVQRTEILEVRTPKAVIRILRQAFEPIQSTNYIHECETVDSLVRPNLIIRLTHRVASRKVNS